MCKNFLKFIIDYVEATATPSSNPTTRETNVLNKLNFVMDRGFILDGSAPPTPGLPFISVNEDICCGCEDREILASVETYLKYTEAVGISNTNCCVGMVASMETFLKGYEAVPNLLSTDKLNQCCFSNYNTIMDKLMEINNLNFKILILDKGPVFISNQSFQPIFDYFSNKSAQFKYAYINELIDKGVIHDCYSKTIMSIETFLKYAEAVG